jgi:hypothetical protein
MVASKLKLSIGITILAILLLSYFFKIEVESGTNYSVTDSLLGVIIFHNFILFVFYILIALFFVFTGMKKVKFI